MLEFLLADDIVRWELQPDDTWVRCGPLDAFEPHAQARMYRWVVERQQSKRTPPLERGDAPSDPAPDVHRPFIRLHSGRHLRSLGCATKRLTLQPLVHHRPKGSHSVNILSTSRRKAFVGIVGAIVLAATAGTAFGVDDAHRPGRQRRRSDGFRSRAPFTLDPVSGNLTGSGSTFPQAFYLEAIAELESSRPTSRSSTAVAAPARAAPTSPSSSSTSPAPTAR